MPTLNAAATLKQADDFDTDYTGATLTILDGATVLATHSIASWTTANSGSNGVATAGAIADATIANSGTADGATMTATGKTWTLTVGTSGAEVNLSTLTYVSGETSSVSSAVVTFPA